MKSNTRDSEAMKKKKILFSLLRKKCKFDHNHALILFVRAIYEENYNL